MMSTVAEIIGIGIIKTLVQARLVYSRLDNLPLRPLTNRMTLGPSYSENFFLLLYDPRVAVMFTFCTDT